MSNAETTRTSSNTSITNGNGNSLSLVQSTVSFLIGTTRNSLHPYDSENGNTDVVGKSEADLYQGIIRTQQDLVDHSYILSELTGKTATLKVSDTKVTDTLIRLFKVDMETPG